MRVNFFWRLFLGLILLGIMVAVAFVFFSLQSVRDWHRATLVDDLIRMATSLRPAVAAEISENSADLRALINRIGREIDIRVTVIEPDGTVVADSLSDASAMENHRDRPEIIQAFKGTPASSTRFSSTMGAEMLYVAVPINRNDQVIGTLRLSRFSEDIQSLVGGIRRQLFRIGIILIVLAFIVSLWISRRLSQPVRKLVRASQDVAAGNYDIRVYSRGRGEISLLIQSFNQMVERQKTLFTSLASQREELEAIISSISEGLMVIDAGGEIKLANRSLKSILKTDNLEGLKYWEACRNSDFYALVQRVTGEKGQGTEEIELNGRNYVTSVNPLQYAQGMVITFHDISEIKRLETIKKDFVTNVSHELKTPLTAIKGFVETLESDRQTEEAEKYIRIIHRNTNRLINIVHDLLRLSQLEELPVLENREEVDLKELLGTINKLFEPVLKKKNLSLSLDFPPDIPPVQGDPFRLEDMFTNLIDNAIKYTEKGGITIRLAAEKSLVRCEIQDTGIGIAPEHIDRIFERFYVTDLSRSKEAGGTGLGLSIVKHIVLLHGGTIQVKSTPGTGTTFTIQLPVGRYDKPVPDKK